MSLGIFRDFDFTILNSPEFKEDAVREEIIAPILKELGYLPFGDYRILRSKVLKHPSVMLASKKKRISVIPDYLLQVNNRNVWVLDAKSPSENIQDGSHVQQVYFYSIHPEVRTKYFALCNGQEFSVFSNETLEKLLYFEVSKIDQYWVKLNNLLSPLAFLEKEKSPQDISPPEKPSGNQDYMIEKEIGVLWSNLANEPVCAEIVRFKGQFMAKYTKLDMNGGASYELYKLQSGRYVVYISYNHRGDYGGANMVGVNAWDEVDPPLTLERLQDEFPELATKAGLSRIREIK